MLRLWILIPVLMLGGCNWLNQRGILVDHSDDYVQVRENDPLIIPEALDSRRIQDPFPIPPIAEQLRPEYYPKRPPRPSAIYANDTREEVRILRLGDRRWLAIPEGPTTVWPKIKQFLVENGVPVEWEHAASGRLDTRWLEITNQGYRDLVRSLIRDAKQEAGQMTGRDRLRLRVEPGFRERTSEIHLRYENDDFATPGPAQLLDLTDSPSHLQEAEQRLLTELGAYIAARVAEQTVSMVAQDIGAGAKSFVDRDPSGEPVLRLLVDQERAWAAVGQSLNRAEIDVTDSNESDGTYRISIPADLDLERASPGKVRRLFGALAGAVGLGGDDLLQIQLRLAPAGDGGYSVFALNEAGEPLEREFGQQVLVLVREYAS